MSGSSKRKLKQFLNCSTFFQWHVDREAMASLLVKRKGVSNEEIVARLVAVVHVYFASQVQWLKNNIVKAKNKKTTFTIALSNFNVKDWISKQDGHGCFIMNIGTASPPPVDDTPIDRDRVFILMRYEGTIGGVSFSIPMAVSIDNISCNMPDCKEDKCSASCGGCGIRYCGPDHQKKHWPEHALVCKSKFHDLTSVFLSCIRKEV